MSDPLGADALVALLRELEHTRVAAARFLISEPLNRPSRGEDELSEELRELIAILRSLRSVMLENPAGARSVVQLLVQEGKRFAETEEGRAWQRSLLGSPPFERLREVWGGVSLGVFDDPDDTEPVPTAWLDLLSDMTTSADAASALTRAMRPGGLG